MIPHHTPLLLTHQTSTSSPPSWANQSRLETVTTSHQATDKNKGPSSESEKGWLNGLIIWHAAWKETVGAASESSCIGGLRHSLKLTVSPSHDEVILCACFQWCTAFLRFWNCMFVLPRTDHWLHKWCLNIMQVFVTLLKTELAVTAFKPRLLYNA